MPKLALLKVPVSIHTNYSQSHYRFLNPSTFQTKLWFVCSMSEQVMICTCKPRFHDCALVAAVCLLYFFWNSRICDYFHLNSLPLPERCQTTEARQHQIPCDCEHSFQALEALLIQTLNTVCMGDCLPNCVLKVILQWLIKNSIHAVGGPRFVLSLIICTLHAPLLAGCYW